MRCFLQSAAISLLLGLTACSDRQTSRQTEEEWSDIQPMADDARPAYANPQSATNADPVQPVDPIVEAEGLMPLVDRLQEMKNLQRREGETLLTGESLVFDQDQRFVKMQEAVTIVDDEGRLTADRIMAHFSASNRVDRIEAVGSVRISSGERTAKADEAEYLYTERRVRLEGRAEVSDGANRIFGERIDLWVGEGRRLVCEPNAVLELADAGNLSFEEGQSTIERDEPTEIRANRVEYDETERLIQLAGGVRLRDPRGAMNCQTVRIYLKDTDEIDWLEALGEVIIQVDERKALAERARYDANEAKFTLEGEPKIKQGLSIMTGDRILFWPKTRRMICEPNARALLYPDKETRARFEKDLSD